MSELYTLVTVVFDDEMPLLRLQARSLALYAPSSMISEIIIIENSKQKIAGLVVEDLIQQYGPLHDRVRFMRADEVCKIKNASGWDSQQILKLAVSKFVHTDKYIVLDAKTHLVNTLDRDLIVGANGRARANVIDYRQNALLYSLRRALQFFQVKDSSYKALDSVTPFVFYAGHAQELIENVSSVSGKDFSQTFLDEGFTEFILYSVWLESTNKPISLIYDVHQRFPTMIWEADCEPAILSDKLKQASNPSTPFLSVHRRSFNHLEPEAEQMLGQFWCQKGLFKDEAEALSMITGMKRRLPPTVFSRASARWLKFIYFQRRVRARFRALTTLSGLPIISP